MSFKAPHASFVSCAFEVLPTGTFHIMSVEISRTPYDRSSVGQSSSVALCERTH